MESKISSHFIRPHQVFLDGRQELVRLAGTSGFQQDDSRLCLAYHCSVFKITIHHRKEVAVSSFVCSRYLFVTEGYQIKVIHGSIGNSSDLSAVLFRLTNHTVFFQSLLMQKSKSFLFHFNYF